MPDNQSCAIYAPGGVGLPNSPFGKDVANLGLYRALYAYGGFDEISFLLQQHVEPAEMARTLAAGQAIPSRISTASLFNVEKVVRAGTLLRGKAELGPLAWRRRELAGDGAYSLVGLVHCVAPPALRRYIADATLAPVQPWDALICTSPVVRDNLLRMYEALNDHIRQRFGAPVAEPRMPQLPVVPLGVEAERFAAAADRPGAREEMRARLRIGPDEILVLWVGRLSFFEKAFPQPMFRAVEEAAARSGKRLRFVMAGWFPNGDAGRRQFEEAAQAYAPSVPVTLLDGTDQAVVGRLWAAADIFISLVDNIQETFGITPVEAMAAGLPVVVSDWDGYRSTVEHGRQGFLIETLGGPPGLGAMMLQRHELDLESYQSYVGAVAQHTAVHVGQAAAALAALASDPELRARMGAAGRERVRTTFDWPVVVAQLRALFTELAERRATDQAFEGASAPVARANPAHGEPFAAFADFATGILADGVVLRATRRISAVPGAVTLDRFAEVWRAKPAEASAVLSRLREGPLAAGALLDRFPGDRRTAVQGTVMWLCKLGFLEWSRADPG